MRKLIVLIASCTFFFFLFEFVDNAGVTIPLVRHKSVSEQILASPHKYDKYLRWMGLEANRTNHSIALYRFFDMEFYANIVVGHPGKTFKMALDTAWDLSWVLSSECPLDRIGCWMHNKYDHGQSSSWKANGTKFNMNEGKYNLTGYYSEDSFSIGQIRVNNQSFVEMTSVPWTYMFSKIDGLLGLGLKYGSYTPFFYNMMNNKSNNISKPLFSIYLNRDRQSNRGGNVFLGFIEKKHIHVTNKTYEPIVFVPMTGINYWQFKMDKIVVNIAANKKPIVLCPNGCNTVVDSSNNIIVGPPEEVAKIHELFKAKRLPIINRYMVNCDTANKMQPIDFIIKGQKFTLKNDRFVQKMSYMGVTMCISSFTAADSPTETGLWVLGGAFLSEFYSVYDIGNRQIGFVKAA